MRLSFLSLALAALPSAILAAPTGTYSGFGDIFGRAYAPQVVQRRSELAVPPPPVPHPHPSPSPSPSSGGRYFPRAFVPLPSVLPLGAPNDLARCPRGGLACPITPRLGGVIPADEQYECVSPEQDLFSCGGCATLGTGTDCSAIPHANAVSCAAARCQVHACKPGYIVSPSGSACTPALAIFS